MTTTKKKKPSQKSMGRPTKFNEGVKSQILAMAKKSFTDVEVCDILHITEATLTHWKKKYPDFFTSLKENKRIADQNVVRSLYERACGFECPSEEKTIIDEDGKEHTMRITKYYPPDPTSMIFWLKNRDRENWRDKHDHQVTGDLVVNLVRFSEQDKDKEDA